ncbi:unnamed protein product [Calicophoron daubneyi]|uniref:Uncharacterized protein n=1 Tax=Calicophoron daubneyi TaxID=300641 RepID=A0AAV2SZI3_CALDB
MDEITNRNADQIGPVDVAAFNPNSQLEVAAVSADAVLLPSERPCGQVYHHSDVCSYTQDKLWSVECIPEVGDGNVHVKDATNKRGLIKKLLRRTPTSNSDRKNRTKFTDIRSSNHPGSKIPSAPSKQVMGNVHQVDSSKQGSPLVESNSTTNADQTTTDNIQTVGAQPVIVQSETNVHGPHPPASPNSLMATTCKKYPNLAALTAIPSPSPTLANGNATKKANVIASVDMVIQLQAALRQRDRRIHELEREVDKLRSVLDQQISDAWGQRKVDGDLPNPISLNPEILPAVSEISCSSEHDTAVSPDGGTPQKSPKNLDICPPAAAFLLQKRLGVSGESMRSAKELTYHEKDAKSRQQIREALRSNELLMNLDAVQLQEMVSCMHDQTVPAGCFIIREGDDGEHLYVGAEGEYEVSKGGKRLCIMTAGRCFGELALLYNCKRTASVKALVESRVWVLERGCFQTIMMKTGLERIEERKAFLRSVPLLKDLPSSRIMRIADALEAQYHAPGECIIRQGELADSFFLIQSGKVNVTISSIPQDSSEAKEINIRQLSKGEFFGEKALLGEGRRTANVYALGPDGVEVLCLYRKDFLELIGDIQELKNRSYVEDQLPTHFKKLESSQSQLSTPTQIPIAKDGKWPRLINSPSLDDQESMKNSSAKLSPPWLDSHGHVKRIQSAIKLEDLERICVLGVGGFGRVDLVTLKHDRTKAFAMKRMQKQHIVQTRQQEHVHFEKLILSSVNSPFICRLYATYRDSKYVYLLLEACLGGELWTILRDSHHLDDRTSRFCLACCIEALDYLHRHGIVYRDLKPENMLITARGYIKLCDFGFAKYIGIGHKTWTFCGTPEYVAPEVILNKGHDFAADYWSLGILTFELLAGTPPFQASEPIKIYMKTLKGIDALGLAQNKYISLKALHFIRRLCRFNPSERLGVGKHGIQEIRSHKYFQGFDWAAIAKQTLPTPFKVKLNGPLDYSNFDRFTMDEQEPPDENSGWDADF